MGDDTPTWGLVIFIMALMFLEMVIMTITLFAGLPPDETENLFIHLSSIPYVILLCAGTSMYFQIICHEAANPYGTPGNTATDYIRFFKNKKQIVMHILISASLFALLLTLYIFGVIPAWVFSLIPTCLFIGMLFALGVLTSLNKRKVI